MTKFEAWFQIFLAGLQAFAQSGPLAHHQIAANAHALADEAIAHVPSDLITDSKPAVTGTTP